MVDVFGNSIIGAYTGGVSVKEIYANGVKVWPTSGPVPPESYYIQWTPILSSGTFSIGGVTYNFSDYPDGVFYLSNSILSGGVFLSNSSIVSIDTNVLEIHSNTFKNCVNLHTVFLPNCTIIENSGTWGGAFINCFGLSQIVAPNLTSVGNEVFEDCSSISEINLSEVTYIGSQAFFDCINLRSINIPKCLNISGYAFARCYLLSQISLPECNTISDNAFYFCSNLTHLELPMCSYLGYQVFYACSSLSRVTLGYSSVVKLKSSNAFSYTSALIYVPSSLVSAYKSASEWSYFSNRIYPIQ